MPYGAKSEFRHQEVRSVPAGYKVRTVKAGSHEVRVAFPPGPRRKDSGIVVGILHPKHENGCSVAMKNPAELLLMGANPGGRVKASSHGGGIYDSLSVNERLAFGRLGLGKAQIRTRGDVAKARRMVQEAQRLKNRLPNPSQVGAATLDSPAAEQARDRREGFSGLPSEHYTVRNEPHMSAGDYSDCGEFIAVAVKPTSTGTASTVQEISFPSKDLELVCDPSGRQLYIVGVGQDLSEADIRMFTDSKSEMVDLGQCRAISYGMKKFGHEVPAEARGEDVRWDHEFGEEGGTRPTIFYNRKMRRLILGRATYHVEGSWIRN